MCDNDLLPSWIKRAGFSARLVNSEHEMIFAGKYRDWRVCAQMMSGWLLLRLYILQLPALSIERHSLFKICLEINDQIALGKFCISNTSELHLCLEYRVDNLDAERFRELVEMMLAQIEEHYPQMYNIARSSATLSRLEDTFRKN